MDDPQRDVYDFSKETWSNESVVQNVSRKIDFQKIKSQHIFVNFSKLFETGLVSANENFDGKTTYFTGFLNGNNFWT